MSSIMQSSGRSKEGKHEIFLSYHGGLYRVWRKPCGMLGNWVLWKLNGKNRPLDLSLPTDVAHLPNDAEKLTAAEAEAYWKS